MKCWSCQIIRRRISFRFARALGTRLCQGFFVLSFFIICGASRTHCHGRILWTVAIGASVDHAAFTSRQPRSLARLATGRDMNAFFEFLLCNGFFGRRSHVVHCHIAVGGRCAIRIIMFRKCHFTHDVVFLFALFRNQNGNENQCDNTDTNSNSIVRFVITPRFRTT